MPIGALITGRARLTSPSGPVMPGGYDFVFRSFADGIGAQGYFHATALGREQRQFAAVIVGRETQLLLLPVGEQIRDKGSL